MVSPLIQQLPYFHPYFANVEEVCDVLSPYLNQDGTFLLRESKGRPGTLTISVMHGKQVNHFNIERNENGYYLYEKYFKDISCLIEHYKTRDIPNKERIKHIRLITPVFPARLGPIKKVNSMNGSSSTASADQHFTQESKPNLVPRSKSIIYDETGCSAGSISGDNRINRRASDPPLPMSPVKKKSLPKKIAQVFKKRSVSDSENQTPESADVMRDRPPHPLPSQNECPYAAPSSLADGYNQSISYLYDQPRDVEADMTKVLVNQLRKEEVSAMCHCGISIQDSELPCGWSVHRSQDAETAGKLFFVSAENKTSWNLPSPVISKLTEQQKAILYKLGNAARLYGKALNI